MKDRLCVLYIYLAHTFSLLWPSYSHQVIMNLPTMKALLLCSLEAKLGCLVLSHAFTKLILLSITGVGFWGVGKQFGGEFFVIALLQSTSI